MPFFGAQTVRTILSKFIGKDVSSEKLLKTINPYALGGLGVIGWIIWSLDLWGALFVWQVSLSILIFGICIFIYRKFRKKDATAEKLRSEKVQLQNRIKQLSKSYDILKRESGENMEVIVGVANHRAIILSALKNAQSRIIILSGWLTDWAFNKEFRTLLLGALERGVIIYIGYGYKAKNETYTRKEQKSAEEDLKNLQAWCADKKPEGRLINWKYPNHAKLLLVDKDYAICGSFNWLSNSGGQNDEMSIKIKHAQKVD